MIINHTLPVAKTLASSCWIYIFVCKDIYCIYIYRSDFWLAKHFVCCCWRHVGTGIVDLRIISFSIQGQKCWSLSSRRALPNFHFEQESPTGSHFRYHMLEILYAASNCFSLLLLSGQGLVMRNWLLSYVESYLWAFHKVLMEWFPSLLCRLTELASADEKNK